jgi:hypothetical protein
MPPIPDGKGGTKRMLDGRRSGSKKGQVKRKRNEKQLKFERNENE